MSLLRNIVNDPNRRRITVRTSVPVPPDRGRNDEIENSNQFENRPEDDNIHHQFENQPENIPQNPHPELAELFKKGGN